MLSVANLGDPTMMWTKPDFVEIILGMEVTAYVNTDEAVTRSKEPARTDEPSTGREDPG
jgi:coenzyme PQQ precursor peptide PqqA